MRDSLTAMNLFRIKQQLPMVLTVMRHHDDDLLKPKNVKDILFSVENFHLAFTAVASQRSSGGISFMYASAARNLQVAGSPQDKLTVLDNLKQKLKTKRPLAAEFEARFMELKYSSIFTKQKNLVRYILTKVYQQNTTGLPIDPEKMTIEHISPKNPSKASGLNNEQSAAIGNLILVDQSLNKELANKSFNEKRLLLQSANVWVDAAILNAFNWGAAEIEARTKLLAAEAYSNVWKI